MPSSHLILCCPLLLPLIFPSITVFSTKSDLHITWPNIGASASVSVLPVNIQDWFPLGWTSLISLQGKWLSRFFPNSTVQKHQFFSAQLSLCSNSHIRKWLLVKPQLWRDGCLSQSNFSDTWANTQSGEKKFQMFDIFLIQPWGRFQFKKSIGNWASLPSWGHVRWVQKREDGVLPG